MYAIGRSRCRAVCEVTCYESGAFNAPVPYTGQSPAAMLPFYRSKLCQRPRSALRWPALSPANPIGISVDYCLCCPWRAVLRSQRSIFNLLNLVSFLIAARRVRVCPLRVRARSAPRSCASFFCCWFRVHDRVHVCGGAQNTQPAPTPTEAVCADTPFLLRVWRAYIRPSAASSRLMDT